jgi:phosphoribosylformimino-5-aminoimidazole carboxamide ribotide isomerase
MNVRRTAVSLAVAAALPGAVMAQSAEDAAIEEIVTIGVRTSILDSINEKRASDVISDVIDAGALGSLPDQSIADALGRVPGVTTIRDAGQSSQLNIRGMDGDFIQTTLNGREQASTAGYSSNTRWMSFDQYPAELISQAAVYKSPMASQLEGGVAGIVELKTVNPLDAPKEHNFVLNGRLSQNDAADSFGGDKDGYRISASYQGKFADDTLGVAAGYSFLDQPNTFIMSRVGADDPDSVGFAGDGSTGNEYFPRAFQWQAGTGSDERTGIMAAVNWQPNDKFMAKVDYFHSKFDRNDVRAGITASGFREAAAGNNNVTGQVIENGVVTSANIAPIDAAFHTFDRDHAWFEARSEDQTTEADSTTYGINLEWYPTESSTLTFDWYRSEGEKTREDRIASLHAYEFGLDGPGTFEEVPGQSLTYTLNGQNIATGQFNGVDFTDPATMRLGRYERYPHAYTDDIEAFKVDFKQDLDWGPISSVQAGVRVSDREFTTERGTFQYGSREGLYNNADGSWCEANDSVAGSNPIPCEPQSIDGFVRVQSLPGVPDHFAVTNLDGLGTAIFGKGNDAGLDKWSDDWTLINDNTLTEETRAIYLMANLDFELGNIPVRGNIGVRYVESDVKTAGLQNVGGGNGTPITDDLGVTNDYLAFNKYGPDFNDTLPSLNLAFELTDNDILRFAAAKVMSRPPVGNMIQASGNWSGAVDPGTGLTEFNVWNDGSPFLDPFRADQYDLSLEHYFEDGGAVTAAVFYKDIESLVEGPVQLFGVDPDSVGVNVPDGSFLNIYQTWVNNDRGGYIRGYELAGTKTFESLPGVFAGLGATVSFSHTESETSITGGSILGGDTIQPLPGLSENVWSTTVFWDIDRFSAHVNMRYRDEFIQKIPVPGQPQPAQSLDYTTVDAQVSYAFDNGISVVFSGNNLTDEPARIEYGVSGLLGEYRTFGRQYYLGINYQY